MKIPLTAHHRDILRLGILTSALRALKTKTEQDVGKKIQEGVKREANVSSRKPKVMAEKWQQETRKQHCIRTGLPVQSICRPHC